MNFLTRERVIDLAIASSRMTRDEVDAWFAARVRESPSA